MSVKYHAKATDSYGGESPCSQGKVTVNSEWEEGWDEGLGRVWELGK